MIDLGIMFCIFERKMTEQELQRMEEELREKGLLQFRTFDKYTQQALINNELIFGAAKNFNDPFDCNLPIDLNNTKEEIHDYLNLINKKSKFTQDHIESLAKHYFDNKNKLERDIRFRIYDFRRFSCFHIDSTDEVHKNSLFWANYADKHKGVCMKFKGDLIHTHEQLLVSLSENINSYPIDYVECKPTFNYLYYRILKELHGCDYAKKQYGYTPSEYFFTIKSKHWEKENEVRFIFKSSNDSPIMESYKNIKFNPKMLERVYLGCNASQSTINDVLKIMHLSKYKHVELIKLLRDNQEFKFNEEKLK